MKNLARTALALGAGDLAAILTNGGHMPALPSAMLLKVVWQR